MIRELDIGQSALLTDIAMCINHYRLSSPGLYVCTLAPVQLDDDTRFFPGVLAMVNHGQHKQCDPDPTYSYFKGPPNFVLDVFPGDDLLDYEQRRDCFERAQVIEYVALQDTQPVRFLWNRLIDGKFSLIETDDPGMIRSTALPGLWIPVDSLQNRNWWSVMSSIAQGVTRRGHYELMKSIWEADANRSSSPPADSDSSAYVPRCG
ncbi:MAG: hypothetical protein ABGZ53_01260 [Fuerstiella sp.]